METHGQRRIKILIVAVYGQRSLSYSEGKLGTLCPYIKKKCAVHIFICTQFVFFSFLHFASVFVSIRNWSALELYCYYAFVFGLTIVLRQPDRAVLITEASLSCCD